MPIYRLLAADGNVVETYAAADDETAAARGRYISRDFAAPAPWLTPHPVLRVDRRGDDGWSVVCSWNPWEASRPEPPARPLAAPPEHPSATIIWR